jgi:hypothetical protein
MWTQADIGGVIERTEPARFTPKMPKAQVDEHLKRWKSAVERA